MDPEEVENEEIVENEDNPVEDDVEDDPVEDDPVEDDDEDDERDLGQEPTPEEVIEDYIKNLEEEGDEEDADDEDEEDDGEETEEDLEGLEDEEEKTEKEELYQILGSDSEEVEEEPFDIGEVTDDQLIVAMGDVSSYKEWMDVIKEEGGEIDASFARFALENDIKPGYLSQQKISNFKELNSRLQALEEINDPEAVLVPKEDDKEGVALFRREHMGIPESKDDYDSIIFKDSFMDGDEEGQEYVKEYFHSLELNNDQLAGVVHFLQNEKELTSENKKEDNKKYWEEQKGSLEEIYGRDYSFNLKENNKLLSTFGKDFLSEFKGSRILNSASFFNLLTNLREEKITRPLNPNLKEVSHKIKDLPNKKLTEYRDKLLKSKYSNPDMAEHEKAEFRQKHEKIMRSYRIISREIKNRGL